MLKYPSQNTSEIKEYNARCKTQKVTTKCKMASLQVIRAPAFDMTYSARRCDGCCVCVCVCVCVYVHFVTVYFQCSILRSLKEQQDNPNKTTQNWPLHLGVPPTWMSVLGIIRGARWKQSAGQTWCPMQRLDIWVWHSHVGLGSGVWRRRKEKTRTYILHEWVRTYCEVRGEKMLLLLQV